MAFEVFWAVYVNFYCISKENYGSINIYNNVELFLNRKLVSIFKSVSMKTVFISSQFTSIFCFWRKSLNQETPSKVIDYS